MKETISVTQADIDRARAEIAASERYSLPCLCPVAQAMMRCDPQHAPIAGHWQCYRYNETGMVKEVIAQTPADARAFMQAFDAGQTVEPLTFEVEWGPIGSGW